ncbi:hypothetical protein [Flavobacterium sp. TAB 87]|uniref:hypothetical protein n=1 Tax=Flavobacterium sp. TAB 87 TaxID=1729581 RepID=UPI00076D131D|nr:hypothetical protein [Flavobacterium sp. TAB 87]KVV16052.1 hypothetical protein AP058_00353 [Flavobacterium sp. TAB 87]
MLEQLAQIVQYFGNDAVVQNDAIPNEQNQAVLQETGNSIFYSLQKMASEGDLSQLAALLQGNNISSANPAVQEITNNVSGSLTEKFGLSSSAAIGAASSMIPQILGSLMGKANDKNDSSFNISDIIAALTSGNSAQSSGIMEAINKYGMQFGLDQNADGKVDLEDAMALTKNGGLGSVLGKLFGK